MLVKTKIFISLLVLVSATVLVFSYAKSNEETKTELAIGEEAICPVRGDKFTITESTPVVEYEGKKYYFCCPGCDAEFMKNPEKYINQEKDELQSEESEKEESIKKILYWTCSMHPEVKADEEGTCPICNMNLMPVYEKDESEGSLHLNDRDIELAGIRMVPVTKEHLYKEVHTVGRVAYDPELVIAQEEYLNALMMMETINGSNQTTIERAESVLERSEFKLRLLGMDESEIKRLSKTRQVETSLIIPKNETWVYADVYESDIAWIKKGQKVAVTTIAYPGEEFQGKIRSVNPILDAHTRSVQVRIRLSNANMKLKPGMYVDVHIKSMYMLPISTAYGSKGDHKVLAIPKESVLDTGKRRVVWVYVGEGNFQPRELKLGPEAVANNEDISIRYYPVLKGLEENELVVTNGNFLVDSESQLTGIAALEYGGALGVEEKSQVPVGHQH